MTHILPLPDFTHERVEVTTGPRSGLFVAVALHSSTLGSALGGARLWRYSHWSDALGDVLELERVDRALRLEQRLRQRRDTQPLIL